MDSDKIVQVENATNGLDEDEMVIVVFVSSQYFDAEYVMGEAEMNALRVVHDRNMQYDIDLVRFNQTGFERRRRVLVRSLGREMDRLRVPLKKKA